MIQKDILRTISGQRKQISLWRALGFACNRTWVCLLFFSSALFVLIEPSQRWTTSESIYLGSITFLAVSLAFCGIFHEKTTALLDSRGGFLVGPIASALSISAIAFSITSGTTPGPLAVGIASIGTGVGSSLVLLDIGRSYRASSTKTCALEVLGATALAALVTVTLYFLPPLPIFFIVLALPFCAELCVRRASAITCTVITEKRSLGEHIPGKLALKFVVAAFILGVATGFMRDSYSYHGTDAFGIDYGTLFMAGTITSVLLLITVIMASRHFSIKLLYKPVIVVCILGFVLAPSLGPETAVPYLLVTIGYTVFEIVIWILFCDMANRFQYTFVQVFGIGRAVTLAIGVMAGSLIARAVSTPMMDNPGFLILASGVAIGFILVSYLYLLTEHDLDEYDSELYGEQSLNRDKRDDAGYTDARGEPSHDKRAHLPQNPPVKKVPLLARCKMVGSYYSLSRREVDVFHLLVLGRTAARIQEELMISAGTVNTHTYHIYQKLDVHSQQELIDLMQASDLDAIEREIARRTAS